MSIILLIAATIMYVLMMIINGLANSIPLNGITTGAVSYKYPNLFQPSGITFSIWGVIYGMLLVYLIYQYTLIGKNISNETRQLYDKINLIFALTSILNGAWLFAWHYDQMIISTFIIALLLISLIILTRLSVSLDHITKSAFSIYLGWITIATIANITIALVKYGMPGFNQSATLLTVLILFIGLMISILWVVRYKDFAFGAVIIWAYLGIVIRHMSKNELDFKYPLVYISTIICLVIIIAVNIWTIIGKINL